MPEAPLPPGSTIGILGGGQLGRMLSLAAARLGLKTHIYSDEAGASAFDVAAARTGAADGPHSEMAQRDGVELAVSRAGDEARGAVLRPLGEMDHEMLPVPHGGDHGHLDPVIGIRRLHHESVRALHELEIDRDKKPQGFLNHSRPGDALDETHCG